MAVKKKSEKRIRKEVNWDKIQAAAEKYKNCLFVDADNVSSKQIANIRVKLRANGAKMVMGKNTLMKAALTAANEPPKEGDDDYEQRKKSFKVNPNIEKIISQLTGNTNLIFSNGDLGEVKAILDGEVRPSPAKAGMIAPDDVTIPAGATGLDPRQTSFFQTLQIQTKIVKAQIDIVVAKQVIFTGEKIDSTQAALLDKLKIYPFAYKMHVKKVLQDGSVFDAAVLDLSNEVILSKFRKGCQIQAQLSLSAGYATTAAIPHIIGNGFKNMVAVCASTGYSFPQAAKVLEAAANAPAGGAGPVAAKAEAAPVIEEKKEEAEDVDMGGLFGDDDDY